MARTFYEMIGRLFSRQEMRKLGSLLEASGTDFVPEAFAGFILVLCIALSMLCYLIFSSFPVFRSFVFKLSTFISLDLTVSSPLFAHLIIVVFSIAIAAGGVCMIAYVALLLMADSRRRKVEEVLPDFLSLSASNVRAGMTIDQAMWYAAKPEFGILSIEVATVAKKTFGGVPFNQSIDYLSERFNSKSIRRSVALIKQGMASGGQLADILERTADDTRQMEVLKKDISASLLMYVIFIVFAGAIGTPFLFAVSGKLVAILEGVFATLPTQPAGSSLGGYASFAVPTKPAVTSSDFFLFTLLSCAMTAIFSSLIIGVISRGSKRDGVPYIPFLLLASLLIFFVMGFVLDRMLSGIAI